MSLTPSSDACLARSTAGPIVSWPPTPIVQTPPLAGSASFDTTHAWTRQPRIVALTGAVRVESSGLLMRFSGGAWGSMTPWRHRTYRRHGESIVGAGLGPTTTSLATWSYE